MNLKEALLEVIYRFLGPYFKNIFDYGICADGCHIDIVAKKRKEDPDDFVLMQIEIVGDGEIRISSLFLPFEDRGRYMIMRVLSEIYKVAKRFSYKLLLVQITGSFHEKMLSLGAIQYRPDAVRIVDGTRFSGRKNSFF